MDRIPWALGNSERAWRDLVMSVVGEYTHTWRIKLSESWSDERLKLSLMTIVVSFVDRMDSGH
jgi:hypothetical protein